jgi:hypothetical protein
MSNHGFKSGTARDAWEILSRIMRVHGENRCSIMSAKQRRAREKQNRNTVVQYGYCIQYNHFSLSLERVD